MAVDLPWGDPRTAVFSTSVGLITTNGPFGHNVMACEWTHQLSYSPGIIGVCIGNNKATLANLEQNPFFGVSLASTEQNVLSSIAGKNSGKSVDKIAALSELGFSFSKAKQIDVFLVDGAAMRAECRVIDSKQYGSHTMFVGEIVELYPATDKKPLIYHNTKYSAPGELIPKPNESQLSEIARVLAKHPKKTA